MLPLTDSTKPEHMVWQNLVSTCKVFEYYFYNHSQDTCNYIHYEQLICEQEPNSQYCIFFTHCASNKFTRYSRASTIVCRGINIMFQNVTQSGDFRFSVAILLNSSMSKISNDGWSKVFISSKVNGENVASVSSISISVILGGGVSIKLLMLGRITVFSNAAKNINQYFLQVIK